MMRFLGGGLNLSSPLKKKDRRSTARAFTIVVWLIGLAMFGSIAYNVEWRKVDWFAAKTWLDVGQGFLGVAFLVVFLTAPPVLFWAIRRIIRARDQQPYGWPIAIFSIFAGIIAMMLWMGLILEDH